MSTPAGIQIVACPTCGTKNRVDPKRQAVCGKCRSPLTAEVLPLIVTDQNFAAEVEKSPLPVLVDFWAAWCGPCRLVAPIVEQLAKELGGKVRVGKLDFDTNQITAGRFRVQSIPSFLIFNDGKEVDRLVGVQSKEAILRRLQAYL